VVALYRILSRHGGPESDFCTFYTFIDIKSKYFKGDKPSLASELAGQSHFPVVNPTHPAILSLLGSGSDVQITLNVRNEYGEGVILRQFQVPDVLPEGNTEAECRTFCVTAA
jgi:hypothetical protein